MLLRNRRILVRVLAIEPMFDVAGETESINFYVSGFVLIEKKRFLSAKDRRRPSRYETGRLMTVSLPPEKLYYSFRLLASGFVLVDEGYREANNGGKER